MYVMNKNDAPRRERAGLTSHILLQQQPDPAADLVVTWVDVAPGARQALHAHAPQQVYVIVAGAGEMRVAGETRDVGPGDLIFIPSGAEHGIVNTGDGTLTYLSAATPAWDVLAVYDHGALQAEAYR